MPEGNRARLFAADVQKYYAIALEGNDSWRAKARLWALNQDFRCVWAFRFGQAADRFRRRHPIVGIPPVLLHRFWSRFIATIHHFTIDRNASIGRGFFVMHRNGVFIGPAVIGENCVVHHNVTIGQKVADGDRSVPRLGSNVWIGPGVILSGGITIGDGVTISAGTVLSKSVPDRCLVAGNPGRVIANDYDNAKLINYELPSGARELQADGMRRG